jgi:hypothetical protein
VLSTTVAMQSFEPIARRHPQIVELLGRVDGKQLGSCTALNLVRQRLDRITGKPENSAAVRLSAKLLIADAERTGKRYARQGLGWMGRDSRSPNGAKRNPGLLIVCENPGLRCAPSGLRLLPRVSLCVTRATCLQGGLRRVFLVIKFPEPAPPWQDVLHVKRIKLRLTEFLGRSSVAVYLPQHPSLIFLFV